MRTKTILISERNLMFAIAGQLYEQAPNRQPRKADVIMGKVKDAFRKVAYNSNEYYSLEIEIDKLRPFVHGLLNDIPEFEELNLTYLEYEAGIKVDDPNRPQFKFTSRYSVETTESWKNDFIDLSAFEGNVVSNLYMVNDYNQDCFFCAHAKTDKCNTCSINPEFKINYESERNPKGKYTFSCKHNCFSSKYICCEECKENKTCLQKCDGKSETCGLAMYKKKVEE